MDLSFWDINEGRIEVYSKKDDYLGAIEYYPNWNTFIWEQDAEVFMSRECLQQVLNKLEKLNKKRGCKNE